MLVKRASLLLLVLLLGTLPVNAAPVTQGTNLINSPGFEGSFSSGTDQAWARWHEERNCKDDPNFNYSCRPDWSSEVVSADLIHSGSKSQHVGVYYTPWHAGVMQTVNVAVGSRVRLTAWGRSRASQDQYPAPSDGSVNSRMQVGIDPEGAGIWYQGVVWSGEINPLDVWQAVSIEATVGASGRVTAYLASNFAGYSRTHLDSWWDDVTLEVVTPPTATPAPVPTQPPPPPKPVATNTPLPTPTPEPSATPVPTLTPTDTPEPTATSTPSVATVCVVAFDDGNRDGTQDGIEGPISGVTITLFDGHQIVGSQTTNALAGDVCFQDLKPGPYQVFQTVPPSRQATTADSVPIELQAGQPVMVLFGSAVLAVPAAPTVVAQGSPSAPTAVPAAGDEPSPSGGTSSIAQTLLAISGVVVLLFAAVLVAVYFVFRNR